MYLKYLASLSHFIPELICCITMFGLIILEATYRDDEKGRPLLLGGAFLGLFLALVWLVLGLKSDPTLIFTKSAVIDPFSSLIKILMVLGTMGAIFLSKSSKDISSNLKSEFAIMATGVLIGGMLLASANNLLILYIGIETLSILSYVMASFSKDSELSSEAGLKYALYGGVSAGIMLFGMSHIFGMLGTIEFGAMAKAMETLTATQTYVLIPSFILFFTGIGYKIACAPFHMWAPDVYEGSPIPVTTFFAIVPKLAGIAVIVRISMTLFGTDNLVSVSWISLITVVSALTMTVGNVAAIGQQSVKRMLAYSSISHAGVMLMGVVVVNQIGAHAILFYGLTYIFMTLVAFYMVSYIQDKYGNDNFDRFNGLLHRYPLMAILLIIVMLSLGGIPPLAGFVAKYHIFVAVLSKKYYALALIGGLNSVISLYYYLRLVRIMVFKEEDGNEKIEGFHPFNQGFLVALTLPVVVLGLFWSGVFDLVQTGNVFIQ